MNIRLGSFLIVNLFSLCMVDHACAADTFACTIEYQKNAYTQMMQDDRVARTAHEERLDEARKQGIRMNSTVAYALAKDYLAVDKINQSKLDDLVSHCGWPKADVLGKGIVWSAAYIVLHAPLEYQKKYISDIQTAYRNEELPASIYNNIEDRMLLLAGEAQKHGTNTFKSND